MANSSSSSSLDLGPGSALSSGQPSSSCVSSSSRCGSVFAADPLTDKEVRRSRVMLLYTGGALGWKIDDGGSIWSSDSYFVYGINKALSNFEFHVLY